MVGGAAAFLILRMALAATTEDIDLLVPPPGCLGSGGTQIGLVGPLWDHLLREVGDVSVAAVAESVLSDKDRDLFPEPDAFANVSVVRDMLRAPEMFVREVAVADLPVIVSNEQVLFQYPYDPKRDWLRVAEDHIGLGRAYPEARLTRATLVRYRASAGEPVLSLEWNDAPLQTDLHGYIPEMGATMRLNTGDGNVTLYVLGRRLARGSRVWSEIEALRRFQTSTLVLHPGGLGSADKPELQDICGESAALMTADAMVPREQELALGVAGLRGFVRDHALPYVAANLFAVDKPDALFFPPYRVERLQDVTVAVVGLIDPERLGKLVGRVSQDWRIEEPAVALEQTLQDLHNNVGQRPDLIILLYTSDAPAALPAWSDYGVDIVIGRFMGEDLRNTRTEVRLTRGGPGRSSYSEPLWVTTASRHAVARVQARLGQSDAGYLLERVVQINRGVPEQGPLNLALEQRFRSLEEQRILRNAQVLLPDPAPVLAKDPTLRPLVWGERVYFRGHVVPYPETSPARFSQPLWMRFLTNTLLLSYESDVVIGRAAPRHAESVGTVQRWLVSDWLAAGDELHELTVPGNILLKVLPRLRSQTIPGPIAPVQFLSAAGLSAERSQVRGRPILADDPYRVLVTDAALLQLASLDPFFSAASSKPKEGAPLLRDAVLASIEAEHPVSLRFLEERLRDWGIVKQPVWSLRLREITMRASRTGNSSGIRRFADTLETRLTTPESYTVGGSLDTLLLYDRQALAWDTRLTSLLERAVFLDTGEQEIADDAVLTTELRVNAVATQLGIGSGMFIPYVNTALDSEFTPTLADDGSENPRQLVSRSSTGIVLYPGALLQEVRVGGLVETDLSVAPTTLHYGLRSQARYEMPLLETLRYVSELDVRYLVPSSDDDTSDLALLGLWTNKLLVPLGVGLSLYLNADGVVARGQVQPMRRYVASVQAGGGLRYSRVFR